MSTAFWQNKKVLITGHTGFKGSWLAIWLQSLGADVVGLALPPNSRQSLFEQAQIETICTSVIGDINDLSFVRSVFEQHKPEIVFHLAAQSLVGQSYSSPIETLQTNIIGTANVLEVIKEAEYCAAAVLVSTDKCYQNKESLKGYSEEDQLGGHDPYSASKACMEIVINAYRRSFFNEVASQPLIASARAGNVVGGGDYAVDRLIPDILKSVDNNQDILLRRPLAVRPWQHVLEPLWGYMLLAQQLVTKGSDYAQAFNFGPTKDNHKQVSWIVSYLTEKLAFNGQVKAEQQTHYHETLYLALNADKAHQQLAWQPKWSISHTLDMIVQWHQLSKQDNFNAHQICLEQIENYMNS